MPTTFRISNSRRRVRAAALMLGLSFLSPERLAAGDPTAATKPSAASEEYPSDSFSNSPGGKLCLRTARGQAATVLVCLAIDCPISNEYIATLNRLAETYRARGVNFIGINPSAGQTLAEMAAYARQFKLAFPFAKDEGAKISRRLLFQVTPEVCVFDARGKLAYRGRIDDRFRAGGSGEASVSELERALDEILAGKPPTVSRTKPVGCPIQLAN